VGGRSKRAAGPSLRSELRTPRRRHAARGRGHKAALRPAVGPRGSGLRTAAGAACCRFAAACCSMNELQGCRCSRDGDEGGGGVRARQRTPRQAAQVEWLRRAPRPHRHAACGRAFLGQARSTPTRGIRPPAPAAAACRKPNHDRDEAEDKARTQRCGQRLRRRRRLGASRTGARDRRPASAAVHGAAAGTPRVRPSGACAGCCTFAALSRRASCLVRTGCGAARRSPLCAGTAPSRPRRSLRLSPTHHHHHPSSPLRTTPRPARRHSTSTSPPALDVLSALPVTSVFRHLLLVTNPCSVCASTLARAGSLLPPARPRLALRPLHPLLRLRNPHLAQHDAQR
jgi:hypothetical protein